MYSNNAITDKSSNSDRIYYNIVMPYNPTQFGVSPMIYRETLTEPIIKNPSEWYLAVVRFTIPTQNIPIFIAEIQPYPNTDLDKTIYSVTLTYDTYTSGQVFVQYVSTTPTAPRPPQQTASRPFTDKTPYYYVYTYTEFLSCINTAYKTAFTALNAAVPGGLPEHSEAPYFIFDPINERISLICQTAFYDRTLTTPIKIYCNYKLLTYLDGVEIIYYGSDLPDGKDILFSIYNQGNNFYRPPMEDPPMLPDYYIFTQQYPTLVNWNSFKSLQLKSSLIPAKQEYVPKQVQISGSAYNTSIVNTSGILKDFEPLLQLGPEARTTVQYQLGSPYFCVNLNGTTPIQSIDISIYWTDQFGNEYLLDIPFNQIVTLKMVFIRKSTFTG